MTMPPLYIANKSIESSISWIGSSKREGRDSRSCVEVVVGLYKEELLEEVEVLMGVADLLVEVEADQVVEVVNHLQRILYHAPQKHSVNLVRDGKRSRLMSLTK